MTAVPTLPLTPQGRIPLMGFGTWPLKAEACREAVETALACGYRHLDTADMYANQEDVGAAIQASEIPREQIFLTTKVWRDQLHADGVLQTCDRALRQLRTDYLDLLLIHWPNNEIPLAETLRAMATLMDDGRIRACGVSNFTARRLEQALALDIVPISNNQVEYHPLLNQKVLHRFCQENGVVLTAYSPLAQGEVEKDALLQSIAGKYHKTPSQVALRWLLQRQIVAVPKASSRAHIESNFAILDFELSPEDFHAIDDRDIWVRQTNWDVGEFG